MSLPERRLFVTLSQASKRCCFYEIHSGSCRTPNDRNEIFGESPALPGKKSALTTPKPRQEGVIRAV